MSENVSIEQRFLRGDFGPSTLGEGAPEVGDRIFIGLDFSTQSHHPTIRIVAAGVVQSAWVADYFYYRHPDQIVIEINDQIFNFDEMEWAYAEEEFPAFKFVPRPVDEDGVVAALESAGRRGGMRAIPAAIDDETLIVEHLVGLHQGATRRENGEYISKEEMLAQFVDFSEVRAALESAMKNGRILRVAKGARSVTGHTIAFHASGQDSGTVSAAFVGRLQEQRTQAMMVKLRARALEIVSSRHADEVETVIQELVNAEYEAVARAAEDEAARAQQAAEAARSSKL